MRPTNAGELRDQLFTIFPEFRTHWEIDDNEFIQDGHFTYHGVMFMFSDYFAANIAESSEKKIRALAEVFNQAVTKDDDLENAVSTVFLEHMHQLTVTKLFGPFLTAQAKKKAHA